MHTFFRPFRLFVASILLVLTCISNRIEAQQASGICARGAAVVPIEATHLRLSLQVQAQGRDAKDAIQRLAAFKRKVAEELRTMNALATSIRFYNTKITNQYAGLDAPNPAMEGYMSRIEGQLFAGDAVPFMGGDVVAGIEEEEVDESDNEPQNRPPKIFVATTTVDADWELPTKDPDALAILPLTLQEQVLERDLTGKKNTVDLNEVESKLARILSRRMQQMGMFQGSEDSSEKVGIRISFFAKPNADQLSSAFQSAIAAASEEAKLIAKAGDLRLGKLISISRDQEHDAFSALSEIQTYTPYSSINSIGASQTKHPQELFSKDPSRLELRVKVELRYEIAAP